MKINTLETIKLAQRFSVVRTHVFIALLETKKKIYDTLISTSPLPFTLFANMNSIFLRFNLE
jgi:hypothetical protein